MNYPSLVVKTGKAYTPEALGPDENPFSTNKVTGWSLNFPIAVTCSPTKVCIHTCYFGRGPSTWPASLAKQHRLYNRVKADPAGAAEQIAAWARRLKLTFVRWNGGGDLFPQSVVCLNHAARMMLDIPQWVVTRLPAEASSIQPAANVFVHFSVDRHSWQRLDEFKPRPGLKWFWSYQCEPDEVPPESIAPVVFRDGYDPQGTPLTIDDCPLNAAEDIAGTCERCRRCFSGAAVARAGLIGRPR